MSQTPRGSDPYDYNPDYNRLNEQYNQNGQYGQNTQYGQYGQGSYGQYGQSSYDQYSYDQYGQDSYSQYGQNQYDPYGQQYQQQYQYGQPMMVPIGIVQKTPEQLAGEKAAQTSTVLGIIGLACIVTLSWSLVLGVVGIFKANEAERFGAAASAGRIMSWISVAIGGMFLVLFGGSLLLAIMLALSDSAANSRLVETAQMLVLF